MRWRREECTGGLASSLGEMHHWSEQPTIAKMVYVCIPWTSLDFLGGTNRESETYRESETKNQKLKAANQKLKSANQKPKSRESETKNPANQKLKCANQKQNSANQKLRIRN